MRGGSIFIALISILAFIAACFGLVIDGFSAIIMIGIIVTLTFTYVFGVIGFTGHPPKILEWTR